VVSLALQTDGHVLVAGQFTEVAGWARDDLARVHCIEPATESLLAGASGITWLRGGTSPELSRTTFDHSLDGISWTPLGVGSPFPEGGN
jgi:hypothetical protein